MEKLFNVPLQDGPAGYSIPQTKVLFFWNRGTLAPNFQYIRHHLKTLQICLNLFLQATYRTKVWSFFLYCPFFSLFLVRLIFQIHPALFSIPSKMPQFWASPIWTGVPAWCLHPCRQSYLTGKNPQALFPHVALNQCAPEGIKTHVRLSSCLLPLPGVLFPLYQNSCDPANIAGHNRQDRPEYVPFFPWRQSQNPETQREQNLAILLSLLW